MENAIKLAIEGGWDDTNFAYGVGKDGKSDDPKVGVWHYGKDIFLDPIFWQCLGKSLGWSDLPFWRYGETCIRCRENLGGIRYVQWQYNWHRFIDHLASGGDVDSFFADLLDKK